MDNCLDTPTLQLPVDLCLPPSDLDTLSFPPQLKDGLKPTGMTSKPINIRMDKNRFSARVRPDIRLSSWFLIPDIRLITNTRYLETISLPPLLKYGLKLTGMTSKLINIRYPANF